MADINDLLKSRTQPEIDEPIKTFARGHMTLTVSLLSRWPDIPMRNRSEHVDLWFRQFSAHMEPVITKWYDGKQESELTAKFITTSIEAAVAHLCGDTARTQKPEAEIFAKRLTARGNQILRVLKVRQPTLAAALPLDAKPARVAWGQHGAHFPNIEV